MTASRTVRPCAVTRIPRLNVIGTGFSVLDPQAAVAEVVHLVDSGETGYVTITNADGAVRSLYDEELRAIYNNSYLTTPDGTPVVWLGRVRGHNQMARVYGPDLMLRLFIEGRRRGWTHYFYGGREGVAEQLKDRLEGRFPGSRVVGTCCPPFRDLTGEEEQALVDEVNRLRPDLFWVGISSPRQDQFMARMIGQLDTAVMLGVGAAFDFHSGQVGQARTWVQDAGLEWLYRLSREPRRLWSRYSYIVPRFLYHAGSQALGLRRYPDASPR